MPTKVYYNSACPVCRAGIKDQRLRMEKCGITSVEWVDVHHYPDAAEDVKSSLELVRERYMSRMTRAASRLALMHLSISGSKLPISAGWQRYFSYR